MVYQSWHISHGILVMAYYLWHISYGISVMAEQRAQSAALAGGTAVPRHASASPTACLPCGYGCAGTQDDRLGESFPAAARAHI